MSTSSFEKLFIEKIRLVATADDPAHDFLHFQRVVACAKKLAQLENAKLEVIIPAAWFHDLVIIPKNDPRRSKASKLSAEAALKFLAEVSYPKEFWNEIAHAVEAHSFSANIECQTLEAKIVQDADRLDGLGAIGLARCFATAGLLRRPFYNDIDPFCDERKVDDSLYTIDHFYAKLFKTYESLKTEAGRLEGKRRIDIMKKYLEDLKGEILVY
jgi:uncharacterized protein